MYYKILVKDYIKLESKFLKDNIEEHLKEEIANKYEGMIDKEIGIVINLLNLKKVDDGIFIPEDGYVYFYSEFELLVYKPEINEIVYGEINSVTTFGAFINIGVLDGLVHIGQVGLRGYEFKDNKIISKDGEEELRAKDLVKARIVAVSYKEKIPKVALTMRQPGLGKMNK